MPYITEEIWQVLTDQSSPIMISDYPVYNEKYSYKQEEDDFSKIIDAIKAVRNRRTEMNVPPSVIY